MQFEPRYSSLIDFTTFQPEGRQSNAMNAKDNFVFDRIVKYR